MANSAFIEKFLLRPGAQRVRFGPGELSAVAQEVEALGAARALVLATKQQQDKAVKLAAQLGDLAAGVFAEAQMHTPVDVTVRAMEEIKRVDADCTVALGGGSTTGLGKAIAYRTDLPQVVIPTTYAGSEATAILGQTEDGIKTTVTDEKIRPESIIYDAELLCSLPKGLTITSALNAMAHAIEALYAKDHNPLSTILAQEGLRAFAGALPKAADDPSDVAARGETLYGAWLCGTVLGQVGMALHHKLCHTLGGSFDLPHAETHAIVLPHAVAYNQAAVPEQLAPVAEILGGEKPASALHSFARECGAPLALRELGMKEDDLDRAVEIACSKPYWNPRPLETGGLRELLQRAWAGDEPG